MVSSPEGGGPAAPAGGVFPDPAYAELHCLSNFTFLRGASHPEELVAQAVTLGYSALALTDECSVAGVVRAHMAARGQPLTLVTGSELRLACGLKLVVLARDRQGYGQLCRLISRGRSAAPKGEYRLTRQDVGELGLTRCFVLWLPGRRPQAGEARWLADLAGSQLSIAVELLREGDDGERLAQLTALGRELGVPLVAAGDVHMHVRARRRLQDALTAVRLNVPLAQAGWQLYPSGERCLRERGRLARLYPQELLAQSIRIAQDCTFSLDELRYEYPQEIVPEGQTPSSHLRALTLEGARRRWPDGVPERELTAIEHELALIADLSYEPFFLTVHDIVTYARERGILCQGRGSAANSRVCYYLGITAVDPERGAALLFERFLSRERNEPPDIDVDFEHERREEVIQYVYGKYGRERAALACSVITYRPKSALRDLGKALGLAPEGCVRLAKLIQWWDEGAALAQRLAQAGFDPGNAVIRQLLTLAGELTRPPGFPRHLSQHVGGFVISRGPLDELVPRENAAMPERTVVQWDKDDLNDLGLLKVDILALGMLTALRRAFALVNEQRGTRHALGTLPPEDPAVYDMICAADTIGVFQIESRAQMSMLPRLKPRSYYDLVIEIAIVRPGPIQGDMVHPYLRRRRSGEKVEYPKDEVRAVLDRTLGVPIFQEQVMQLAVVAAGFSPGEADALRRAMGAWKRTGGIDRFKERLLSGMRAHGYDEELAQRLYRQMLGFGEYGFPECIAGDTRVIDADSGRWVRIEDVHAGREVLAATLACDQDLRLQRRRVMAVKASGVKPVWRLRTALGHTIVASAEHPFLTVGGWRKLRDLEVGDHVACMAPAALMVEGEPRHPHGSEPARARALRAPGLACPGRADVDWDRVMAIEAQGELPTYDLSIEGDHNFVANHLVVHNSHSASFALLAYDSAWLKRHEPAAFACALLNSQPMGFYAPAQLVRDARAHGVEVRPVDVTASAVDCSLERCSDGEPALRLGLRMVRSLSQAGAGRLVAVRAERPFESIQDMSARAALERRDLEALAAAGALACLSGNRHLAFWEVAGTERPLPLAPPGARAVRLEEGQPLLTAPTEGEGIVADYRSVGLTLGRHPLALLRERLLQRGLMCAADLACVAHGRQVRTAGIVLMRQRPATARGVTFVTLEDESGQVNVLVWESVGREHHRALVEARLLEVHGELQRQEGIMHLIAAVLIDRTRLLGALLTHSRDFH
jgi:error-prone DNA polymerase